MRLYKYSTNINCNSTNFQKSCQFTKTYPPYVCLTGILINRFRLVFAFLQIHRSYVLKDMNSLRCLGQLLIFPFVSANSSYTKFSIEFTLWTSRILNTDKQWLLDKKSVNFYSPASFSRFFYEKTESTDSAGHYWVLKIVLLSINFVLFSKKFSVFSISWAASLVFSTL